MERKVLWSKPTTGKRADEPIYTSKCGRYQIQKDHMASLSGRNGHFGVVVYRLTILATGAKTEHDTLRDAKDEADMDNDPNWEPS
jgi:hypothetical protein